ncbi:MAG: hypothetical protein OWU33_01395 [Firmicutes bacterium]|nr:hypothetical protein [Bacillota bacterium]
MSLSHLAAAIIWLAAIGMMIVKSPRSTTTLYRLQALGEAALVALSAWTQTRPLLWASVALIIVVKVVVVPWSIHRGFRGNTPGYSAKSPVGTTTLLMLAALFSAGGYLLAELGLPHPTASGILLAALLVALLHTTSRYEVWSMLWGLLSLDTVVGASIGLVSPALPATDVMAVTLVTLALALVLALLARWIRAIKPSLDVRQLEELTG